MGVGDTRMSCGEVVGAVRCAHVIEAGGRERYRRTCGAPATTVNEEGTLLCEEHASKDEER